MLLPSSDAIGAAVERGCRPAYPNSDMLCPDCGHESPEGQRFCGHCGRRLDEAGTSAEIRKTVTILFSDVAGSTELGERLDPEAVRGVMARYFDLARAAIERHGGTVEKFIGDAVMAVFGVPILHEDDALRATRAAWEIRDALTALNEDLARTEGVRLAIRTGVNSGEVVVGSGGRTIATGDAVNTAARLEQTAGAGEVLLGELTHHLVRDAVLAEPVPPLVAKGKAEPLRAWRLAGIRAEVRSSLRRDRPILGRATELELLRSSFERVLAERTPALVTLIGAAGVGKSRLVDEFVASIDADVLRGRCLPYGEGITYWPVAEMLTRRANVTEHDGPEEVRKKLRRVAAGAPEGFAVADRLAQLLGVAGVAASTEETHWAVRSLLEHLAHARPVVIEIDDLQWAEPTLLELVEHVVGHAVDVPLLVLCSARPELLEERTGWPHDQLAAMRIRLEPLAEEDAGRLVRELLGGIPDVVVEHVATAAGRVPLFVEHLVAMLVEEGAIAWDGARWVHGDLSAIAIPPSVGAVIGARLERLPPEELATLERAAVEGQTFHRGAVLALSSGDDLADVSERLDGLERRDLVRRAESRFAGDTGFEFRHLLVRDAAYARISKRERAVLHERFAAWLDERAGVGAVEYDEIVGYHLERSATLAIELAPGNEHAHANAARAATRLAVAGSRALERGDVVAAEALLGRADRLDGPEASSRVPALLDLGVVFERQGRYQDAVATLRRAEGLARAAGDRSTAARAVIRSQVSRAHTERVTQAEQHAEVESLLAGIEASGDVAALAEATYFLGLSFHWLGRAVRAMEFLERAQDLAVRSGMPRIAEEAAGWYLSAVLSAPVPAADAVERWRVVSSSIRMSRYGRAFGEVITSEALAMTGDVETARAWCARGREVIRELGDETQTYASTIVHGEIELHAGDFAAADRVLAEGERGLERLGDDGYRSTVLASRADALQAMGRTDEAIAATERSEAIAVDDDVVSVAGWRSARARAVADLGRLAEAEPLAREALELLLQTEWIDKTAHSWSTLGYVLAVAGRTDEATGAYREALELCERKGMVLSIVRLQRTLVTLEGGRPGPPTLPSGPWGTTWPLNPISPADP
jgi:class 3 adenylate cyclase/predicted ATPase